jgi:hypothetical protein
MSGLGRLLLAATTLSSGCLSFCHPIGSPPQDQVEYCRTLPPACRNHVYIFFVNGLDPLGYANFAGLRDYVQSLGFIKTYYGQVYHEATFAREIRRLHREDTLARFVIAGLNLGVDPARDLAEAVRPDGIFIDLLVTVGADSVGPPSGNVGRVVNLPSTDETGNGLDPDLSGTRNGTTARRFTLATLAHELAAVAGEVPVPVPTGQPAPAPVPGRAMPQADAPHDEWDFLKPRPAGGEPPPPASPRKTPQEPALLPPSIGRI